MMVNLFSAMAVLGPSYTCNICYEQRRSSFDLHKSCAELLGEIHHPIHRKHPLTLDTSDREKSCSLQLFPQCEFNIDLQCASNWRNILDFHDHKFTLNRKPAQLPCEACGKESVSTRIYSTRFIYNKYGTAMYLCSICQLLVHGCCSRLPTHIKTAQHQHRLKLTWWFEDTFPKIQNFCDLCYGNMDKSRAVYYCEHECCSYVAHNDCATRRYEAVEDSAAAADDDRIISNQIELQINHFSHPHVLALINIDHQDNGDDEDDRIITCNGCMRPITKVDAFYSCTKQESSSSFFLHTACAQSPKKMHLATIIGQSDLELHPRTHSIGGVFKCLLCYTFGQGFVYLYEINSIFGIDFQCAILWKQKSLKHEAHVHTLQFNKNNESTYKCRGCGTSKILYWFSCRRCDFHLCFSCVKLPPTARHKYDNHPLKLTYNSVENELDEYYCEICEGKRDPGLWFYSCSDCDFDCHPHCILGRYPQVKLGDSYKHPTHPHLVTLVDKRKSEIPSDKRERILPSPSSYLESYTPLSRGVGRNDEIQPSRGVVRRNYVLYKI
ncbi:uncharacterized protein LOC117635343 [Prunus dulcis]|uniref:uncharacterized protein LOC117635343 n=1 Tax=Prunus dulcis TaxID=3755 RepID=UPI001482C10A|nr:uncharacterized protein LOC117635343 [Prunus dulcis]